MGESSGLQGLDALFKAKLNAILEAKLKEGFEQASQLQNLFTSSPRALDSPIIIADSLDKIVSAFSAAKGLISLNSTASNFEDHANTLVTGLGGMDLGHIGKHVKDKGNSCSQSSSRSARPRSRSPSPMRYGSPSNVFEGSVSTNWLGKGKQKCHGLTDWPDKERKIAGKVKREKERVISRRGKRPNVPTLTIFVSANKLEAGNDTPPEDGHQWHKYGHKDIRGDIYPKMYYKCTFYRDRDCKATKTAQKPNDNPSVWQVKYTEYHSCQPKSVDIPFPISNMQDGGGNSSSYSHNVDSSAERTMTFPGLPADQMYRSQGSEKEVSADFIPFSQQNEELSNCQGYLAPYGLSSASEANYTSSTNPQMQTGNTWIDSAKMFETDFSSAYESDFWADMGRPPDNPPMQAMDT